MRLINSMFQRMRRHSGSGMKSGHRPRGSVRFFSVCLLSISCLAGVVHAVELKEIAGLAKGGAAELALNLLDESQPEYGADKEQWLRWERMRVRIMEQRGDWQSLAQHLATMPGDLTPAFHQWTQERRARALILSNQPANARQVLRGLLWSEEEASSKEIAQWRQLVMQSYLHEGRVEDAYVAMLRYHQDYGLGDGESVLIRARIQLASNHPAEARSLLASVKRDRTAELLWWLARLRSGESAETILSEIRKKDGTDDDTPLQQYLHYGVMAEAARKAENTTFAIIALERWYRLTPPLEKWSELFAFKADMLWDGYQDYALKIGNKAQLLIGNDTAWLELAEQTSSRYPVRKHSLYALLSQQAYSMTVRGRASLELATMLQQQENGMAVVRQLFLHSGRYPDATGLPPGVAYILVDDAIRDGDLAMASRLLQQLPEPPDNTARIPWHMRRAKVFILAGEYKPAEALLRQLIEVVASYDKPEQDQLIQLLFDLQTVGEHESAYRLLQELFQRVADLKLRRELLFWMADSRLAQGNYVAAARLYLQSATLLDVNSMDPWAQTARYNAAKALAEGGMLADAAHIYTQLLKITENPERRAVLRRGLEQVRMRQAAKEQ